jgi:hypothetical protein
MGAVLEFDDLFDIASGLEGMASLAVQKTIARIHEEIDAEFSAPKSGETYVHGGRIHVASAPGEPPAIDYGNLMGSVSHEMISDMTGEVNIGAEYAVVLELGGARMEARPFAQPAAEKVWPEFEKAMESLAPK